jgi:hypothetical protein
MIRNPPMVGPVEAPGRDVRVDSSWLTAFSETKV